MKTRLRFFIFLLSVLVVAPDVAARDVLRMVITTTTENSGLMPYLNSEFERQTGIKLDVVVAGSGQALHIGQNGDVDLLLVHAPESEQKFITSGYGKDRRPVMHNDFVLLGPHDDPVGVSSTTTIYEAFRILQDNHGLFVSRGDESGTHQKEQQIWAQLDSKDSWDNYRASGQGMGATLMLANELQAYTLSDRGTYLYMRNRLELVILHEGDDILLNPYHVIAVNPEIHTHVKYDLAKKYIEFITGAIGQALIGDYRINGQRLFQPVSLGQDKNQNVVKDKREQGFFINAFKRSFSLIFNFNKELYFVVWTSLRVSLIAVLIASIISIPLGIMVALKTFPGRGLLLSVLNTLMALPTVIVGLLLYGLLNRQGALGGYGLLYTPMAMIIGQAILITPIIWNLSIAAVNAADPRLRFTCVSLGASLYQQGLIYINEVRFALMAAVVAGFGRAIGEVGVAMMLGGNIQGFTRTMTTAIALETSKGEFEFALALGVMLLLVAFLVNIVLQQFQEMKE